MTSNNTVLARMTVAVAALTLLIASPARAHCDALDGPVVKAARLALERSDVTLVLIWVRDADEREIREAFQQTISVRKLNPQARELADRYFFETIVRVHRAGEGAAFTGLKPVGTDPGPGIRAADVAVESKSADALVTLVWREAERGLREHFAHVEHTLNYPVGDLKAGREHVKAYVEFVHYVERLYEATRQATHGHFPETTPHK